MHATTSMSAERAADILDELHMLVTTDRIREFWGRPVDEAMPRMIGSTNPPPDVWAHINWFGPLEIWRRPELNVSDILFNGPASDGFWIIQNGAMLNTGVTVHPSWIGWTQRQLMLRSGRVDDTGMPVWHEDKAQGVADGLRFALTRQPLTRRGPSLSIRMLPERWRTLDDLVQAETITREAVEVLLEGMKAGATILVSGNTGSGKTTLTAGFTQEIAKRARLIFIEDGGELPMGLNTLHMDVDSNVRGAFTAAIKMTLRQKPDYVVVGEVRGGEAMAMLQAAATGHPGIGTIHATNVQGALRNLERLAMLGLADESNGGGAAAAAIVRGLITSDAVSLIVMHIDKTPKGRRVMAIEEVLPAGSQGQTGDHFPTNTLFRYDEYSSRLTRVGNVNAKWGLGRY